MIAMSISASFIAHGVHYAVLGGGLVALAWLLGPQLLTRWTRSTAATPARSSFFQPVAIVSSAAAAGVHAAVGPAHFAERPLFGLFFACSAAAQIGWAALMVRRPGRTLLEVGIAGNLAVVTLWLVTRTVGLGSLLTEPEAFGPWDISCAVWEVMTVAVCALLLRDRRHHAAPLLPRWADWHPGAQAWVLISVTALGVLSVSGAHA